MVPSLDYGNPMAIFQHAAFFVTRHGIDLDRPALVTNGTGDRTSDNATPPMHFLTPHIEISTQGSPHLVRSGFFSLNLKLSLLELHLFRDLSFKRAMVIN